MTHTAATSLAKTSAAKATYGAIVAALLAFLAPIGVTIHAGQPITFVTWFDAVLAALLFASAVFPTVYNTTNKQL